MKIAVAYAQVNETNETSYLGPVANRDSDAILSGIIIA